MNYSKISLVFVLSICPLTTLGMEEKLTGSQEKLRAKLAKQELGNKTDVTLDDCIQQLEKLNFGERITNIKSYAKELDGGGITSFVYDGPITQALSLIHKSKSTINFENKERYANRANKGMSNCLDAVANLLEAAKKSPEISQTQNSVETREKFAQLILYLQNISADRGLPLNATNVEKLNEVIQEMLKLDLICAQQSFQGLLDKLALYRVMQMYLIKNAQDCQGRKTENTLKANIVCFDILFKSLIRIHQNSTEIHKHFEEKITQNLEQSKPSDTQPQDQSK